jgi:hypothetical protein
MWMGCLLGLAVLLLCGLLHTIVAIYVLRIVARLLENGYAGPWFWGNVLVVQISVMVMSVSHFAQIFIWAVLLLICGEFAGLDLAIYASTGNYTTVGTGTVAMPEPWRILGPLEALNGVLMLGVSSAVGFAVMHRVLESRLKGRDPTQGLDLP